MNIVIRLGVTTVICDSGNWETILATWINRLKRISMIFGKIGRVKIANIKPIRIIGPIKKLAKILDNKKLKDIWLK